ncbi:selenocysteine-specific translation elongation factor [bacterium]|nr:selenocysteine-specific translation elongation factor [bacterium]
MQETAPELAPGSAQPEAPRYVVLGTAGHIDHGKTSLVKALTGVDCDRFAEEKLRGITIDLGFAHWQLPASEGEAALELAIIDVPGHRRFIRNMVAGAVGIDLLMLVIAADDGVMPQTIEHLQIARMLGIERGLIALNKADLVDSDLLELAVADVQSLVRGTFLEGQPIIPVSALSGQGLAELGSEVRRIAASIKPAPAGQRFRMPIDRAFTIRGAGTVVTGTVASGTVKVDDELVLMPGGQRFKNGGAVRVRAIQAHGQQQQSVGPRRRAALNLVGVEKDELQRGDVLCTPDSLIATSIIDARIELLPGNWRPLHSGSWLMLHVGTAELGAKLVPLQQEQLPPGSSALVQLRLEEEVAVAAGDRFILRGASGDETVGGGVVLDAHPTVHRRRREEAAEQLERLQSLELGPALLHEVGKTAFGIDRASAERLLSAGPAMLDQALEALLYRGSDGLLVHSEGRQTVLSLPANRQRILQAAERALTTYHQAHALSNRGMLLSEILQALSSEVAAQNRSGQLHVRLPAELLRVSLQAGLEAGRLRMAGESYALSSHQASASDKDLRAAEMIVRELEASMQPDQPEDFAASLPVKKDRLKQVLDLLLEEGRVVLIPQGLFMGRERTERARAALLYYLQGAEGQSAGGITVSVFNQLVGTTRKFGLPLLQYFEAEGLLVRDGDLRRLK